MNEMPQGFLMSLSRNPEAMKRFCDLSSREKERLIRSAHNVTSKHEMDELVNMI